LNRIHRVDFSNPLAKVRLVNSSKTIIFTVLLSSVFLLSAGVLIVANATSSSTAFSTPVNISNDSNNAEYPNVQTNGNYVYVAWTERSHGIMFRLYSISSEAWSPSLSSAALRLSPQGTTSYPLMTDSGNYVYVVWSQTTPTNKNLQIYFASSSDNGKTFESARVIDTDSGLAASTPVIAASGNYVSVAWIAGTESFVRVSSNNGISWTTPYKYSDMHEPQLAEVGANVYAVADGINVAVSHNAGGTWTITNYGQGSETWVAAAGSYVFAAWETKSKASTVEAIYSTNSGSTLSAKKDISTGTPDAWAPMVNVSGSTFYAAWRTNPGSSLSQEYVSVSKDAGSSWGTPVSIGIAKHDNEWPFTVASSGSYTYVMWSEKVNTIKGNNDWQTLVAFSSDGGSSWSGPVSLSTSQISGAQPEQDIATGAIASTGASAFAVWQNNQTASQIYFSRT
jgi:hypothetical protein